MCKILWEWISRTKFLVFPSNYSEISCCWSIITIHVERMSTICNSAWNITICVANGSIFLRKLLWAVIYFCGYKWFCIDRENCGLNLCPVNTSRQVGLKERWIKRGHILSYDFEHHKANASPEWACDFTSIFANILLVEIVFVLNRWYLIKVHIDTAVQEQPHESQHSAASLSHIFTTFTTNPKICFALGGRLAPECKCVTVRPACDVIVSVRVSLKKPSL